MSDTDDTREPRSMSVILDGPEIDALARHHRREVTRLNKAGKPDEAAHHAARADAMLQAAIALTMERTEPPAAVTLDANGMDQQGRLWVPIECGNGVRMVPMTSGACLAVWQAYDFAVARDRARGRTANIEQWQKVASEFLALAGMLDVSLSILAENPPSYGAAGWS